MIRRRYYNHTARPTTSGRSCSTPSRSTPATSPPACTTWPPRRRTRRTFSQAAQAYKAYLTFFGKSKNAALVRANLAEALYAAKRYLEAGSTTSRPPSTQRARSGAIRSTPRWCPTSRRSRGRRSSPASRWCRRAPGCAAPAAIFIQRFPKDEKIVQVKFNIARTYYDAGEFDEAIRLFTALVHQFPTSKEAPIAAHLVLDAYRNMEDYEGLIAAGKAFAPMANLGDTEFKSEVAEIVKGAENRLLDSDDRGRRRRVGERVRQARRDRQQVQGHSIWRKALINAFVTAARRRPREALRGRREVAPRLPELGAAGDVLAHDGQDRRRLAAVRRGRDLPRGRGAPQAGEEAADMYKAAGTIRAGLGQRAKAEDALNSCCAWASPPQRRPTSRCEVARLHIQANDWGGA